MCMILYQGQSYSAAHRAIRSLVRFFFASDLVFFLEIGKKGGYFGLGMGPIICPW